MYLASGPSLTISPTAFSTYTLDQKHSLIVYFNNHATHSYLYAAGSTLYTLASNKMDVWLDGVRVGTGLGKAGGLATGVDIGEFNFTSQSNFIGTLYIDDLVETIH